MFFVEGGVFGLGEVGVAVEAFVDLVACTVFAVFDDVFVFFFLMESTVKILTGHIICFSWARHIIV